jgi:pyruvate kinase
MDVARLNFSHGTPAEHGEVIQRLRQLSEKLNRPIAILQDLPGPKIRIGAIASGSVLLEAGDEFVLTSRPVPGDAHEVSITYRDLPHEVSPNDTILLADGTIELRVIDTDGVNIRCKVVLGGELSSNKGINLPDGSLRVETVTEKDFEALEFGLEQGVDFVALSFVRQADDILRVRQFIESRKARVPIIAKIEKHEALKAIDDIIAVVDGIMVARGDLAVETALERVPLVQKMIIQRCGDAGKPVITATQMLRSMVDSPRPTRAEATDVANAVLDGTDAVMLSEETAIGKYPVAAVATMARIVETTEGALEPRMQLTLPVGSSQSKIAAAICHASIQLAEDLSAAAILTPTRTGATARMVARYRPRQPILALSPNLETLRQLCLTWGVTPVFTEESRDSDSVAEDAKRKAVAHRVAQRGDVVVLTAGLPVGQAGRTNMVKVEIID